MDYFYPKSDARIIDTWDVSGLRGTGNATTSRSTTCSCRRAHVLGARSGARVTGPMNRMHGSTSPLRVLLRRPRRRPRRHRRVRRAGQGEDPALVRRAPARSGDRAGADRRGRGVLRSAGGSCSTSSRTCGRPRSRAADHRAAAADLRLAMTHAAQSAAGPRTWCARRPHHVDLHEEPAGALRARREVVTRHNQLQYVKLRGVGRTVLGLESNSPLF